MAMTELLFKDEVYAIVGAAVVHFCPVNST